MSEIMTSEIKITKVKESRVSQVDLENVTMGFNFTDHMFICDYENGEWQNPRIEPLALIPTHPAAMALHYGQAIFEGMKARKSKNGTPLLFRADENAKRLNFSADRMGMPLFPEDLFIEALKQFTAIEKDWIPSKEGSALYLRPFMYADEPFIGMRAATKFKFMIIASPAGPFFSRKIKLYAEKKYVRAVNGGTGEAKAAGNYAAAIRPTEYAKAKGYDQVLWLDAHDFEYIQEVGTMNIFFKIGGKFITPSLTGSILSGITRMSVIDLLRHKGFEVTERPIKISEIIVASQNGTLEEAFGTGTAVGIAMIEEIGNNDLSIKFPLENPVSIMVNDTLNKIKKQEIEDPFGWVIEAE
ncbi:branched-chain amino acid aminotransferase [Flavobacterium capsici]|uniref:Branched-chain-amino-acid aminotransferase n=1 Tax=Flavobacterium capsici TaxID=3075618 RepID=A0AA96J3N6_9FLAO|nr:MULTISPECIES: branched-chain amino acid aminotransferase [unclassified Flavobacterium]WNM19086.1 branched-chain amino acid aminotransferase [Flavobacterium sp. PMR2A8]WNM20475.1 branched-chain amino acid aminotransferase [Flavobacterium sp. PMTSA4]